MKLAIYFFLLFLGLSAYAQQPLNVRTYERSYQRPSKPEHFYKKNIIQIEAAGRGFLYSLGYERMFGPDVSLGGSFSYTTLNSNFGIGKTAFHIMSIPLYVNYYAIPGRHNLVLTGGINIFSFEATARLSEEVQTSIAASAEETGTETFDLGALELSGKALIPIPQAGIGYEYRGTSGFLARANLYGMYAIGQFIPWAGLSVGVAF